MNEIVSMAAWIVGISLAGMLIIGMIYRLIKGMFSCVAMLITAIIVAAGIIYVLHLGGIL